jgi:cytochrome c oxidase assembly factor CtaG
MVPLTPVTALTTWRFSPLASASLVAAAAPYLAGIRTVARRHPARPWPWRRTWAFFAGVCAIAVATQGYDASYDDVSLPAHMVQHLLLIMVAPPLLIFGRPVTLLLHATRNPWHTRVKRVVRSRVVNAAIWPPLGAGVYSAVVAGTHLTPLVLAGGLPRDAEHVAYLAAGYLFFLPVIGSEPIRWRLSLFARYLLLLVAMAADVVTGAAYLLARPFGGYSAVDVRLSGLIMLAGSDVIMVALAALLAIGMVRSPELSPAARRTSAKLEAYNAYLASLESPDSRTTGGGFSSRDGLPEPIASRRSDLPADVPVFGRHLAVSLGGVAVFFGPLPQLGVASGGAVPFLAPGRAPVESVGRPEQAERDALGGVVGLHSRLAGVCHCLLGLRTAVRRSGAGILPELLPPAGRRDAGPVRLACSPPGSRGRVTR